MEDKVREKLKKFLKDRKLVRNSRDIALIILESKEVSGKDFWEKLDPSILYFLLDDPLEYKKVVDEFIKAQNEGKIFLLDLRVNPSDRVIQFLKEIYHFGSFSLHDKKGNLVDNIKVKPGSLVVIAQRDFIEKEITYPRFYNIFDTAFDTAFVIKE
jgi:hypothetical protein